MCDKAVDDSLAALKLIPDRFVTSKMIKELFTALCTDQTVLYFNDEPGNAVFFCNELGILNVDINNINLDNNFDSFDNNLDNFNPKVIEYPQIKICPRKQNVSIPPYYILLRMVSL